jgi:ABC-type transport system substrate-binding protein
MKRNLWACAAVTMAAGLSLGIAAGNPALAQKPGGTLRVHALDSPPSLSMHEEVDAQPARMAMPIFNNLVMFDQHTKQNSMASIVPDLATGWGWSEDGTALTFPLRQGVKWHDGKAFTAADVKCTWDLLTGKAADKLRLNPRKSWYRNLAEVTANGDHEATFHLARPQPAFIALLASGFSVIYPCHVAPAEMRQHPIGTGPFKFVEFKPNERVTLTKNADYWKPGRPYLDGIEFTIIKDVSTANLAFVADKVDWLPMTIPLLKQTRSQASDAVCEATPGGISRNLIINRDAPPFDSPEMRRAMALSLDRKAFIDILSEGQGDIGGAMQPLPEQVTPQSPEPARIIRIPVGDPTINDRVQIDRDQERISLTAKDAPMDAVLGLLAEQHGLNIVAGTELEQHISVKLTNVSLEDALDAITLVNELEERGLFDETLVVWMGEFGRTPRIENTAKFGPDGRRTISLDDLDDLFSMPVADCFGAASQSLQISWFIFIARSGR